MKPVLIVEGKHYEAEIRMWGYFDEEKGYQTIHADVKPEVKWLGQYEQLHSELSNKLEIKCMELDVLAHEIVHTATPSTFDELKKNYFDMQREIVSLLDVVEMIEGYMVDDVDLSGGDEIDG